MREHTDGKNAREYWKDGLKAGAGLLAVVLLLHVSGVGCPIRYVTGIPCAGCGMTRAVLALLKGQPAAAFRLHPLVFVLPCLLLLCLVHHCRPELLPKKVWHAVLLVVTVLFIGVYAVRMLHGDPVLEINIARGMLWRMCKEVKYVLSELW